MHLRCIELNYIKVDYGLYGGNSFRLPITLFSNGCVHKNKKIIVPIVFIVTRISSTNQVHNVSGSFSFYSYFP